MGFRFWKQQKPWGNKMSSAAFLAGPIHNEIVNTYYSNKNFDRVNEQINNANSLTQYFKELKRQMAYYQANKNSGIAINSGYQLFCSIVDQILENVRNDFNNKNKNLKYSFFRNNEKEAASPVVFQNEIQAIMRAFVAFQNKDVTKVGNNYYVDSKYKKNDTLEINFRIGDKFSSVDGNKIGEFVKSGVVQLAVNNTVRSMVEIKNEEGKVIGKQMASGVWKFQGRQIKVDVGNDTDLLVTDNYELGQDLQHFAQLLSHATFSAKSYKDILTSTGYKQLASIGKTNIVSVLLQFLPTLQIISQLNDDAYISFIAALFTRYFNYWFYPKFQRDPQPGEKLEQIGIHFFHIQTIYELMGIGQNSKENNIQSLINQGVRYLIVNDWNSNEIKVYSTLALLQDLYRETFDEYSHGSGKVVDYHRESHSGIERYIRAK